MNKALFGLGFGLISVLVTLAIVGKAKKEEVQIMPGPAMEASLRASNKAKLSQLTMELRQVEAQKGSAPELGDLTEAALGNIPTESFSGSKQIVGAYDGTGGWVFSSGIFSVNHPEALKK